jgi:DNA repair exonuclease SbcCD ATPase subunit
MDPIVGNLITLGIVGITLVVFRQFDRNNRGLEKVRKYTERLKEELAAFVAEKEAAVRDYSIVLDTKQLSAKELLNHLQVTDEELARKAESLGKIDERLNAYDSSLEELVRMTARVQENLNWIKEKGSFVDGVHKRMSDARDKIAVVEKVLGDLQAHFERENTAVLEKVVLGMSENVEAKIAALHDAASDIERRVVESREAIELAEHERAEKVAHDMENIAQTLKDVMERVAVNADTMEDAIFTNLRAQAEERVQRLQASIEEKFKSYQETARGQLDEFQDAVKTYRDEWTNDSAEMASQQRTFKSKWERDVQELSDLAHEQNEVWASQKEAWTKAMDSGESMRNDLLSDIERISNETKGHVAQENEALEARIKTLRESAGQTVVALEARLLKAAHDAEQKVLDITGARLDNWRQVTAQAEATTRQLFADIEMASDETKRSIDARIAAIEARFVEVGEQADGISARLEARLLKTAETAEARALALTEERLEHWQQVAASEDENTRRLLNDLENASAEIRAHFSDEIGAMEQHLNDLAVHTDEAIVALRAHIVQGADEIQRQVWEETGARLEQWRQVAGESDTRARDLLSGLETVAAETERHVLDEMNAATNRIESLQTAVDDMTVHLEEKMTESMREAETHALAFSDTELNKWKLAAEERDAAAKLVLKDFDQTYADVHEQNARIVADAEGRIISVQNELKELAGRVEDIIVHAAGDAETRARELSDIGIEKWKAAAEEGDKRARDLLDAIELTSDETRKRMSDELREAEAQLEGLQGRIGDTAAKVEDSMKDIVIQAEIKARSLAESGLENWKSASAAREGDARRLLADLEKVSTNAESSMADMEQRLHTIAESAEKRVLEATDERLETWNRVTTEADANTRRLLSDLEVSSAEIKTYFEGQTTAIEGQLKDARAYVHDALAQLKAKVEQDTNDAEQEVLAAVDARLIQLKGAVATGDEKAQSLLTQLESLSGDLTTRFLETSAALEQRLADMGVHTDETLAELRTQVASAAATLEQQVLASVEAKLENWKQLLDSGDEKTREMRSLLETSRALLETSSDEIKRRFAAEAAVLEEQLKEAQKHTDVELVSLKEQTIATAHAIEEEMNRILSEAEKKAFAGADERFETWQKAAVEADGKTARLLAELESASADIERRLNEEVESIREQLENVETSTRDFAAGMESKLREAAEHAQQQVLEENDAKFEEYRTAQSQEFARLSSLADDASNLDTELRHYIEETQTKVREDFAAFATTSTREREAAAQEFRDATASLRLDLEQIGGEVTKLKTAAYDNVSENLRVFEDDFARNLLNRSEGIDQRLSEWQAALDERLAALAGATEAERETLQASLVAELRSKLAEQQTRLSGELDAKIKDIAGNIHSQSAQLTGLLDESRSGIDECQRDLRTKIQGLGNSVQSARQEALDQILKNDEQLGVIRASVAQVSGEITAHRAEVFARIDERTKSLAESITRADEQLEAFVKQTALFDKANELKADLDKRIAVLDNDFIRLADHSAEAVKLEDQFARIKRIEEDINSKMIRFLSEQHRIEQMETDFNRLLETSKAVDQKLVEVTNSDDSLQTMQVQIRKISDALADAEEKYQRIERKNETLDTTTAGIDRNFKSLQESERMSQFINDDLRRFKNEMDELHVSIDNLTNDNAKAMSVAEKLSLLDKSLSDIEERLDRMQAVRQWVANAETRLNDLKKQLDDQSKLVIRGGSAPSSGGGGHVGGASGSGGAGNDGPGASQRETVFKLKRQGWTVKEIAKATELSIGAVEMTLEFMDR